jgi:hypothetical protein
VQKVKPVTCEDAYLAGKTTSGKHLLTKNGLQVFCQMGEDGGYTFFPPAALSANSDKVYGQFEIKDFQTDKTQAMIRSKVWASNSQFDTVIKQLPQYSSKDIGIYVNNNGNVFQGPSQTNLGSYIFVGLIDAATARSRTQQGFQTNGINNVFTNCDSNPNSYFTFFSNPTGAAGQNDRQDGKGSLIDRWWMSKTPTPEEAKLPDNYFYDVEAHWGGCGSFEWTKKWAQATKFSVGVAFTAVKPVKTVEGATCEDVRHGGNSESGRYQMTGNGKPFELFCQFEADYGYAFFPKGAVTAGSLNMEALNTDKSKVMIRFNSQQNGKQYDTVVEQLDQFKSEPIGVYVNGNGNGRYQGARQTQAELGSYVLVGFIPDDQASQKNSSRVKDQWEKQHFQQLRC